MRAAMIALLAFLGSISVGCQHNLAHNGCGCSQGCASCGGGCNSCNVGGGLLAGGGRVHRQALQGDGYCPNGDCYDGQGVGGYAGDGQGLLHHGDGQGVLHRNAPQHVSRMPHFGNQDMGPPGPPTGTYAYPYYTTRAPRDFLLNNPPSIGP